MLKNSAGLADYKGFAAARENNGAAREANRRCYRKRREQPIRVCRIFHRGRSHWCCPVRVTVLATMRALLMLLVLTYSSKSSIAQGERLVTSYD